MKKYYIVFFLIVLFSVLTLLFINYLSPDVTDPVLEEPIITKKDDPIVKDEPIIGGDRDTYGCLGGAGYTFNDEIGACIREWELNDEQRIGAFLVAEQLGRQEGLTVLEVVIDDCEDCYTVKLDKYQNHFNVKVVNGEIVESKEKNTEIELMFDSVSELIVNVSQVVFAMSDEFTELSTEDVYWNTPEGEMEYLGTGYGEDFPIDADNPDEIYGMILEILRNNGFETDQYNAMTGSEDMEITRMRKGNYICNVKKENNVEKDTVTINVGCVDITL
jgi:hypothetical protein